MSNFGLLAADATVQTFGAVSGFLQESFFNVLTGNFKGIGDAFISLGEQSLKTWLNVISQMVTAWLVSGLVSLFDGPGGGPGFGGGGGGGGGGFLQSAGRSITGAGVAAGAKAGVSALFGGAAAATTGAGSAAAGATFNASVGLAAPAAAGGGTTAAGVRLASQGAKLAATGAQSGFTSGAIASAGALAIPVIAHSIISLLTTQGAGNAPPAVRYGRVAPQVLGLFEERTRNVPSDWHVSFDAALGSILSQSHGLTGLEAGIWRRNQTVAELNVLLREAGGMTGVTADDLPDPILFAAHGFSGVTTRPTGFVTSEFGQPERVRIEPVGRRGDAAGGDTINIGTLYMGGRVASTAEKRKLARELEAITGRIKAARHKARKGKA